MREWSDDEIEFAMRSSLLLAAVSIIIWYFLRPAAPKNDRPPPTTTSTPRQPIATTVQQQQIQYQQFQQQQQQQHQMFQQQQRNNTTQNDHRSGGSLPTRRNNNNNTTNDADDGDGEEDGIISLLALNVRSPPHTSSAFHSTVAHEGIIPFRFTRASIYESSHSVKLASVVGSSGDSSGGLGTDREDAVVVANTARQMGNRKDRARIFTKLFSSTRTENSGIVQPPSRGSNVVLTVPSAEVNCIKLRKVLFLLGSYYNLFVLIALDDDDKDKDIDGGDGSIGTTVGGGRDDPKTTTTTRKSGTISETERYIQFNSTMTKMEFALRGINNNNDAKKPPTMTVTDTAPNTTNTESTTTISSSSSKQPAIRLPSEVLPSHRIVGTTSIGGRVAFVRQLPKRPEFVLEYDAEVSSQLTRFGFAVLLYSKMVVGGGGGGVSGIGKELISG